MPFPESGSRSMASTMARSSDFWSGADIHMSSTGSTMQLFFWQKRVPSICESYSGCAGASFTTTLESESAHAPTRPRPAGMTRTRSDSDSEKSEDHRMDSDLS